MQTDKDAARELGRSLGGGKAPPPSGSGWPQGTDKGLPIRQPADRDGRVQNVSEDLPPEQQKPPQGQRGQRSVVPGASPPGTERFLRSHPKQDNGKGPLVLSSRHELGGTQHSLVRKQPSHD